MNQIDKDIYLTCRARAPIIDYVQNTNLIPIALHVKDYDLTGLTAYAYVRRASGAEVVQSATVEGNTITVKPTTGMSLEVGRHVLQVSLVSSGGSTAASFGISLNVEKNIISDSAVQATNEYPALIALINDATRVITDAKGAVTATNTAADKANTAANTANIAASAAQDIYNKVVNTPVGDLQIGGVNIFTNSNNFKNCTGYQGAALTLEENVVVPEWGATDATRVKTTGGTSTLKVAMGNNGKSIMSIKGQKYVLSVWLKNEGTTNINISSNGLGPGGMVIPSESKRVILYGTGNSTNNVQLNFSIPNAGDKIQMVLWRAQAEYGTLVSDWSPAPGDKKDDLYGLFTDDRETAATGYWHKLLEGKVSFYDNTDVTVTLLVQHLYAGTTERNSGVLSLAIRQNAAGAPAMNRIHARWESATSNVSEVLKHFAVNVIPDSTGNRIEFYIFNNVRYNGYKVSVLGVTSREERHTIVLTGYKNWSTTTTLTALPTTGTIIYSTLGYYLSLAETAVGEIAKRPIIQSKTISIPTGSVASGGSITVDTGMNISSASLINVLPYFGGGAAGLAPAGYSGGGTSATLKVNLRNNSSSTVTIGTTWTVVVWYVG